MRVFFNVKNYICVCVCVCEYSLKSNIKKYFYFLMNINVCAHIYNSNVLNKKKILKILNSNLLNKK